LGMIEKYFENRVPTPGSFELSEQYIKEKAVQTTNQVEESINEIEFHKALTAIWDYISIVNKYVDEAAPWSLAKVGNRERLGTVLWTLVESIRVIAILLYPFIPVSAENIWKKIGIPQRLDSQRFSNASLWGISSPGSLITKGEGLFPRHEDK